MNSVSFSKDSQLVYVTNLRDDVTLRTKLWYTKDEIRTLKGQAIAIANALRNITAHNQALEDCNCHVQDKLCVGFEKYKSSKLVKKYKLHKRALYHAILLEQKLHNMSSSEEGRMLNFDRLAILSNRISHWAMVQARAAALSLELDVTNL